MPWIIVSVVPSLLVNRYIYDVILTKLMLQPIIANVWNSETWTAAWNVAKKG